MDYFLDSLTDIGLRRLYKFVLKRTIGKYLREELLINQLKVQSRKGIVSVNNLHLDCDLLNEELLNDLPVRLVSVEIVCLEAEISYSTILTDGCKFIGKGINIVIEPKPLKVNKDKSKSDDEEERNNEDDNDEKDKKPYEFPDISSSAESEDATQGIKFIANWIEVIVARLQMEIEDFCVTIFSSPIDGSIESDNRLAVRLRFDGSIYLSIYHYISIIIYLTN
jgi:hypothetical protein